MESQLNKLLTRQIKRHFGAIENVPEEFLGILKDINNTYENLDDDILLLQNSIEISSQELRTAFQKHKQDAEAQKETIRKIKEAISVFNTDTQNEILVDEWPNSDSGFLINSLIRLIEERKQAEEVLMESETRFRLMADNSPVLIWKSGTDAKCDYFNQTWLNFTGRTLDQEMGDGWAEGVHPDDMQHCLDTYLNSFNERRKFTMEYRLMHADGKYRWLLDNGVPRFTAQGIFTGYIGTCTDITENKRVEETLRNLSQAVEQNPASIVITDINGKIEYVNPKFCDLTGYTREEAIGANPRILKSESSTPELYKDMWDTILSGKEWKGEFHNKKKNGDLYWELASISAVKNPNGDIVNFLAIKEDITERKQVIEALGKSEKRYREVVQNVKEVIFQTDASGLWIFLNQAWEEITGFSVEESIGQMFVDYVHPDDRQRNMELFEPLIMRKKEYCRHQIRYLTKDGGFRWIEVFARLGLDEKDEIVGTYGTLQDITERKLAEETLKNERTLFRTIIDLIPDAVYVKDLQGRKIIANPKEVELVGLGSEQEILNKTDFDLYPSELAFKTNEEDQLVIRSGKPILNYEGSIVDQEGKVHSLLGSKVPLFDSTGKITGIVGVSHDITERKNAEDALQAAHKSLSDILNAAIHTAIIATDEDGIITNFSKGAERMLGYSAQELVGKATPELFHLENEVSDRSIELSKEFGRMISGFEVFVAKARNMEHEERTWTYRRKDGTSILVNLIVTAIRDNTKEIIGFLGIASDITERKHAEAELEESREKYRGLSEASFEAIFISVDGFCIEQNHAAELMFGYTHEEAMTKIGPDWFVPEDRERVMNHIIEGYEEQYEAVALRKDGTTFPCVIRGRKMHYKGRDVRVTSLNDISLLKKVEQELIIAKEIAEDSERKFKSIIESQAEGIGFVDENEVFGFANTASERIFDTGENELVGTCLYEYLDTEEKNLVEKQTRNRGAGNVNTYELKIVTKKGNTKYIHVTATPKMDENNNYLGAYGVFRDITDQKKAEDELIRISKRLALATFAGGVGVWDLDIESNTLIWDDQMFALYGIEKANDKNAYETWLNALHPEDKERAKEEIQMAIDGKKEFNTEFRICWPDGSIHNIRALANVQSDASGKTNRMIGTNWDITEQKKTESVLLKARQDAEMANKAKSVFLANMSHEIRTPLNAILGFSQLMNRDKHLTPTQREYNISTIRAGEHLLSLINDILELSKMEAGRLELNPMNVDLNALLSEIQLFFKDQVESKHLHFKLEKAKNLPRYILVDDNKLRRIFLNLIGNAIKFTDEGGITVRVKTDQINKLKSRLIVEIQDTGSGIPENEIGRLFKHFVQTSSGMSKTSGTGLGLALSRELANLMGGDITVKSDFGAGSVFTFYIVIETGRVEDVQEVISRSVVGIENGMEPFKILVVDDTDENRQVAVELLDLVGFKTMEAVDGEDAVKKFEEWNPDLILMDMRMPVIDGYEATRRIKLTEKGRQTPVVALTASSFEDERKKIGDLDIQAYIRKPFREIELFGTIGNILNVKYIYDDKNAPSEEKPAITDSEIIEFIAKLPDDFIVQMQDATIVADLDLLIDLIRRIEDRNADLARHLTALANNYDYENLQRLLNKKRIEP